MQALKSFVVACGSTDTMKGSHLINFRSTFAFFVLRSLHKGRLFFWFPSARPFVLRGPKIAFFWTGDFGPFWSSPYGLCVCIYVYVYVYMFMCICICVYDLYMYRYIYMYICICIYVYVYVYMGSFFILLFPSDSGSCMRPAAKKENGK